MATVKLPDVYCVRSKGKAYYYAWKGKGAPRIPGEPGSEEFLEAVLKMQLARKGGDRSLLAGLVTAFKAGDAWNGRGPKPISNKTKASWITWLDRISDYYGELPTAAFDRPQMRPRIIRWRDGYSDTPRAADMGVQVLSRVLSFGMAEGRLMNNVCFGLGTIYTNDRSGLIWEPEHLARIEAEASPELFQAAKLAALSGLRRADLLKLQPNHIKANSIEVTTGKSGNRKTTLIPLYDELRAHIESIPRKAITLLVNTDGVPWKTGFGSSWGKACDRASDKINDPEAQASFDALHFHDLRGTAATRFYKAGLTIREIAEIMTWSEDFVEGLINRYVRKDDLLRDRIHRMNENAK